MKTMKTSSIQIGDDKRLAGAKTKFDHAIPVYDDGWGSVYVYRDSMGIQGIVRAQTWEDAWGICEDEFMPECDLTMEEIVKEYGFKREYVRKVDDAGEFVGWETVETPDPEAWMDNALFQEACGFRPNGARVGDKQGHGIYAKDINGEALDVLTEELARDLEITLDVQDW